MGGSDRYFKGAMARRQALVWASAVRRQLARWEPLVAKHTRMMLEPNLHPPPVQPTTMAPNEYWQGEWEHFFLVVATHNLIKAVQLLDGPPTVEAIVRDELTEARDLLSHWMENMEIFNTSPRPLEPGYPSGKRFAARNPRHDPYNWWSWEAARGPLVSPNVSADQVRHLADDVIVTLLADRSELAAYVEERGPSPWEDRNNETDWW